MSDPQYECPRCGNPITVDTQAATEGICFACLNCLELLKLTYPVNTRRRLGQMGEVVIEFVPASDEEIAAWWKGNRRPVDE